MTHFLARLVDRVRDTAPRVEPIIASRFCLLPCPGWRRRARRPRASPNKWSRHAASRASRRQPHRLNPKRAALEPLIQAGRTSSPTHSWSRNNSALCGKLNPGAFPNNRARCEPIGSRRCRRRRPDFSRQFAARMQTKSRSGSLRSCASPSAASRSVRLLCPPHRCANPHARLSRCSRLTLTSRRERTARHEQPAGDRRSQRCAAELFAE